MNEPPTNGARRSNYREMLNGFWQVNIGQVAIGFLTLGSVFIAYGRLAERFDDYGKTVTNLAVRVDGIDRNGTTASAHRIEMDHSVINDHSGRINKLEEIVGDIKVMKFKVDEMAGDVQQLRSYHNQNDFKRPPERPNP